MSQSAALVDSLKSVLRARGITYAKLAKGLRLSESSVKRVFASRNFTLERLDQVCEFAGIEITDLARMVTHEAGSPMQLTLEQEKEVVSDAKLLLVAVHALNHWSFDEIVETYAITKAECVKLLARLDKLGIIDLLPNNKIRVRVARTFAWQPEGPIQRYFRAQVQGDFFASRFDAGGEALQFVSGMLSKGSLAALQGRLRRLTAEFSELHHQDLELPLPERYGSSLLIALRPWIPQSFLRMRRKSDVRGLR